jgi:hypothetical protein
MPEPIGSIIAYGGEITPLPTRPPASGDWEDKNGWLLCNGREFDTRGVFSALFDAVQYRWGGDAKKLKFNIPDLQGYFLRGVDPSVADDRVDKDSDRRFSRSSRRIQRGVGSFQGYATALPKQRLEVGAMDESFTTDLAGKHDHSLSFQLNAARDVNGQDNTVAYPGTPTSVPVSEVDDHLHRIVGGGNTETRPVNAYVHWIIRYK